MADLSHADIDAATSAALCAASAAHAFLLAAEEWPDYQDRCGRRFQELWWQRSPWQQSIDRVASVVISDQPGAAINGEKLDGRKAWSIPGVSYHQAAATLAHTVFLTASNAIQEAWQRHAGNVPESNTSLDIPTYWPEIRTALAQRFGPSIIAEGGPRHVLLFDLEAATAAIRREGILATQKLAVQVEKSMGEVMPRHADLPPSQSSDGYSKRLQQEFEALSQEFEALNQECDSDPLLCMATGMTAAHYSAILIAIPRTESFSFAIECLNLETTLNRALNLWQTHHISWQRPSEPVRFHLSGGSSALMAALEFCATVYQSVQSARDQVFGRDNDDFRKLPLRDKQLIADWCDATARDLATREEPWRGSPRRVEIMSDFYDLRRRIEQEYRESTRAFVPKQASGPPSQLSDGKQTATSPAEPPLLSPAESNIMGVLRVANRRMVTEKIIAALEAKHGAASVGTTKNTLATLVRRKLLTNRSDVDPRGYGLPEWD